MSGVQVSRRLRWVFRSLEDEARAELRDEMEKIAQRIAGSMLERVPQRSGNLRNLIDYRVAKSGLTARIGYVTPKDRRDAFYARFLEFGTKGYAPRGIPPLAAQPFIQPAFDAYKNIFIAEAAKAVRQALERVSRG